MRANGSSIHTTGGSWPRSWTRFTLRANGHEGSSVRPRACAMIKVTFCAYDKPDNVGGPVSWIRRLFPLLRDRGIEPRCLFIMHWGNSGPALDALTEAGFDCRWITLDRTEDRIRWILEDLRDNPPDVFVPNLVVAAYYAARWAHEA